MKPILIFGGTTEGRFLAEKLTTVGIEIVVSVATEYGGELLGDINKLTKRLNQIGIEELLKSQSFTCVIDSTHPYAIEATENIMKACEKCKVDYYRLNREKLSYNDDFVSVESISCAAEYLSTTKGNILLTTGSKELEPFNTADLRDRVYLRILPTVEAIEKCLLMGFPGKNLIAMQGPFTKEMNIAMLCQFDIKYIVTKESGKAGGFSEKLEAADQTNTKVIVVERPKENVRQYKSYSYNQILKLLETKYGVSWDKQNTIHDYFPLFVSLEGKWIQVFGGGNIALRRIKSLLPYGCNFNIYAPYFSQELLLIHSDNSCLNFHKRGYKQGECVADIVLACTNREDINKQIFEECRRKKIPVNCANNRDDCDFYFPALIRARDLTIGICASGKNHKLVKETAAKLREQLKRKDTANYD